MMCNTGDTGQTCVGCGAPIAEGKGDQVGTTSMMAHAGCSATYGLDKLGQGDFTIHESLANTLVALTELQETGLTEKQLESMQRGRIFLCLAMNRLDEARDLVAGA